MLLCRALPCPEQTTDSTGDLGLKKKKSPLALLQTKHLEASAWLKPKDGYEWSSVRSSGAELLVSVPTSGGQPCPDVSLCHSVPWCSHHSCAVAHFSMGQPLQQPMSPLPTPGLSSGTIRCPSALSREMDEKPSAVFTEDLDPCLFTGVPPNRS